jgi:hypothetical protein
MISSNLHGAKIPPDGCCDSSQGQRDTRGLHQRKRTFHQRQFGRPGPRGILLSLPERWSWEAHDVTLVTPDVTKRHMDMMEAVVCQVARVASFKGLGRPNGLLMEPNVPPMRPNVTLGGHDVTSSAHFRV